MTKYQKRKKIETKKKLFITLMKSERRVMLKNDKQNKCQGKTKKNKTKQSPK